MSGGAADAAPTAAVMDGVYRRQRHVYDLTRRYYLLGRDHAIAALKPPPGGSVLEIGCGTARNLIAAARTWPDARFSGIDVSAEMLATARRNVAKAGLQQRIRLSKADAARFDPVALFGEANFDRILFSYTLSMIPAWRDALIQALRLAAPASRIHIVDFGRQELLPRWFKAALFAWLRQFHVVPRVELESTLTEVTGQAGGSLRFRSLYRGYAAYAEIDLPKSWNPQAAIGCNARASAAGVTLDSAQRMISKRPS